MGAVKQSLIARHGYTDPSHAGSLFGSDPTALSEPFYPLPSAPLFAYVLLVDGQPSTVYQREEDALRDKWLEEQASMHSVDATYAPPVFTIARLPLCQSIPF